MLLLRTEKLELLRDDRDDTIGLRLRQPALARARSYYKAAFLHSVAAVHETRRRQAAEILDRYRCLIKKTGPGDGRNVMS